MRTIVYITMALMHYRVELKYNNLRKHGASWFYYTAAKCALNQHAQIVRSVYVHWYSRSFLVYTDVEAEAIVAAECSLSLSFRRVLISFPVVKCSRIRLRNTFYYCEVMSVYFRARDRKLRFSG